MTSGSYTFGIVYRHFRAKGYENWVFSRNMLNNEEYKYKDNIKVPDSLLLDYKSQEKRKTNSGTKDLPTW